MPSAIASAVSALTAPFSASKGGRYAEHPGLRSVRIGDDPFQKVVGASGDIGYALRHQPSGARLGKGQGQTPSVETAPPRRSRWCRRLPRIYGSPSRCRTCSTRLFQRLSDRACIFPVGPQFDVNLWKIEAKSDRDAGSHQTLQQRIHFRFGEAEDFQHLRRQRGLLRAAAVDESGNRPSRRAYAPFQPGHPA